MPAANHGMGADGGADECLSVEVPVCWSGPLSVLTDILDYLVLSDLGFDWDSVHLHSNLHCLPKWVAYVCP